MSVNNARLVFIIYLSIKFSYRLVGANCISITIKSIKKRSKLLERFFIDYLGEIVVIVFWGPIQVQADRLLY